MASSLASAPAPPALRPAKPTVPLASKGGSFSSGGLLHSVFSAPRIPPHPASCGSASHSPSPAAAEGAAHLLRDSRQHLLHRQDQLSGSGPTPAPPPQLCPRLVLSQPGADRQRLLCPLLSQRGFHQCQGGARVNGGLCVPSRLLSTA